MNKMTYEEVEAYLNENNLHGEINQPLYKNQNFAEVVYDIQISGDWKHDHGYLDYLMEQKDYIRTREELIHDEYDDGGDFYTAVHRYVYKPFYILFNGNID